jgi:hypothetical protein
MEAFISGTEPTEYCAKAIGNEAIDKGKARKNSSWWNDLKRWWNN